jgi:hypothetical protein
VATVDLQQSNIQNVAYKSPITNLCSHLPFHQETKSNMKLQGVILSLILCSVASENVLRGSKENNFFGGRVLGGKMNSKETSSKTSGGMSGGGGGGMSSSMGSGGMGGGDVSVSSSLPL